MTRSRLGLVPVTTATLSLSFMIGSSDCRGRDQEALGRIEDPCIDKAGIGRFAFESLQGAGETHPIECLLLAGILDRRSRIVAPELVVAGSQRIVEATI